MQSLPRFQENQVWKRLQNEKKIEIIPEDTAIQPVEYVISKSKHLTVQEGDYVEIGVFS